MTDVKTTILSVPAENDYLVAIRSIVAATSAHSGLSMGDCDKARTAAHEAAGLIMTSSPRSDITCSIEEGEDTVTVIIHAETDQELAVDETNVAWVLLDSATDQYRLVVCESINNSDANLVEITFTISSH